MMLALTCLNKMVKTGAGRRRRRTGKKKAAHAAANVTAPPTSPTPRDATPCPDGEGDSTPTRSARFVYKMALCGSVERVDRIHMPDGSYVDLPSPTSPTSPAAPRSALRGSREDAPGAGRGDCATGAAAPGGWDDPPAKRSIRFHFTATVPVEHDALPHDVYDRRGPKPWKGLTNYQKRRIKKELNSFKRDEMPVHAGSENNTRFHR